MFQTGREGVLIFKSHEYQLRGIKITMNNRESKHLVNVSGVHYDQGEELDYDDCAGLPFVSDDPENFPDFESAVDQNEICLCGFWLYDLHELINGPIHIETVTEYECQNFGQDEVLGANNLKLVHDYAMAKRGENNWPFIDILTIWVYRHWVTYWDMEHDSEFVMLGIVDIQSIEPLNLGGSSPDP